MSRQFRPQPQANGIAAISAAIGRKTKTPTRIRGGVVFGFSSSESPSGLRRIGAASGSRASAISSLPASVVVFDPRGSVVRAMFSPEVRRPQAVALYAYVTVAYETVRCARFSDEFLDIPW